MEVNHIHEIPNIEKYLDEHFEFIFYCRGDRTIGFKFLFTDFDPKWIHIELITDEDTFFHYHKLSDIITFDNIGYLKYQVKKAITDEVILSCEYFKNN